MEKTKFKSIFISDIHIGLRESHLDKLADFLNNVESENLFLVGDIIDLWMGKRLNFSPSSLRVLRKIIKKAQKTTVFYLPGNHDESMRILDGYCHENIKIQNEIIYESNEKKYLIVHGDLFDPIVLYAKWISHLGSFAYDFLVIVNHLYRSIMNKFGVKPRSLSTYIRTKVKSAVKFITKFEEIMINEARSRNLDGVISGHIHSPALKTINGIFYANCGDWIEHCTVIVENINGDFELIYIV